MNEAWYFLLSPAAILISTGVSWALAKRAVDSNRDIAKKRATFEYLSRLSWDKDYIDAKNTFLELKAGPKRLSAVAEDYEATKTHPGGRSEEEISELIGHHSAIRNVLNEYEALAIGIKCGALDEELLKLNIRQQLIEHVDACREFIKASQENSKFEDPKKLWCEISELVEKWRSAPN